MTIVRRIVAASEDDPKKYIPRYGGYCTYGVAVGAKFDGDPRLWTIVNGKLSLDLNEEVQETWERDSPRHIEQADRAWSQVTSRTPEELS